MTIHYPSTGITTAFAWVLLLIAGDSLADSAAPGTEFSDCEGCPVMVVIPSGQFTMGSLEGEEGRSEGPIHEVEIAYEFAAGKFEVTNAQFGLFVHETGHTQETNCIIWTDKWEPLEDTSWRNPGHGRESLDNEPVSCISWLDAKAYVVWLSDKTDKRYRLPTEAEWEYMARAGTTTRFYWGDSAEGICDKVNLFDESGRAASDLVWESENCDDGYAFTSPVGSFPANPFGLHDVIGNLWEWTEDSYTVPYPEGSTDGSSYQA